MKSKGDSFTLSQTLSHTLSQTNSPSLSVSVSLSLVFSLVLSFSLSCVCPPVFPRSPAARKAEFAKARLDLQLELLQGTSLNDIRRRYNQGTIDGDDEPKYKDVDISKLLMAGLRDRGDRWGRKGGLIWGERLNSVSFALACESSVDESKHGFF